LSWPLPAGMSREQLDQLLFSRREPSSSRRIPLRPWRC
jgi:hypothetical protein